MYDVNILVNGSRCKQYTHDGKIFIEAKKGSEYTIEIKNNSWQRILAICSVDGLDILNGKPAVEDGPGYVINGYGVGKFDGFRVSNEKVAKFLFDYKGGSYAASKKDGSERNVGVIGIRLFEEKVIPPVVVKEIHHHHDHYPIHPYRPWWDDMKGLTSNAPPPNPTIWCDNMCRSEDTITSGIDDEMKSCGNDWMNREMERSLFGNPPTKGSPTKGSPTRTFGSSGRITAKSHAGAQSATLGFAGNDAALGFDMGTKFGEAKESKVIEVDFEKGVLALATNIYYASRQSLIEMGIPLGNEKQVSFPEPFKDSKYAKPPKGWNG